MMLMRQLQSDAKSKAELLSKEDEEEVELTLFSRMRMFYVQCLFSCGS